MTDSADRQNAFETLSRALRTAEAKLAAFSTRFAADPYHAFDWGTDALDAAATKKVATRALALLEGGATVEALVSELNDEVLRSARYGERSTSPVGNELARCLLAARAELLNELT